MLENISFVCFFLALLLFIPLATNAVYFHFRYQKQLDQKIHKGNNFDVGLLLGINRLMWYGHYCISPKRAARDGVDDVFHDLNPQLKSHLVFHFWGVLISALLYLTSFMLPFLAGVI